MRADHKRKVIEELEYHCDHPARVAKLLTAKEAESIAKKGFMTRDIWEALQPRIAEMEMEMNG